MLAFAVVKYLILTKKNFRFLVQKKKKELIFVLTEKNLIKFIKEFAVCQKKLVSAGDVKIVLFVTDLSLFIDNRCTTLTMKKAKCYGKFT